jgi:hypothetical protein
MTSDVECLARRIFPSRQGGGPRDTRANRRGFTSPSQHRRCNQPTLESEPPSFLHITRLLRSPLYGARNVSIKAANVGVLYPVDVLRANTTCRRKQLPGFKCMWSFSTNMRPLCRLTRSSASLNCLAGRHVWARNGSLASAVPVCTLSCFLLTEECKDPSATSTCPATQQRSH